MISVKRLTLATIFLVILLLYACPANNNDLTFVGEGENWSAKVAVYQITGDETYQIQINYKGQSIQEIETFRYHVETKNGGAIDFGGNNVPLNKEGIYQGDLPISNSPSTSENDELAINIEWNGNSEEFILTKR